MNRTTLAAAFLVLGASAILAVNDPVQQRALTLAHDAWAQGDYIGALNSYIKLLNGPGGDAFHDAIAEHTGELYRSFELTADGRAARFSPDGKYIAFETGLEVSRTTVV